MTVTVLAKLPRVRLSLPAPRSIEPLLMRSAEGDGVGAGAADEGLGVADGRAVGASGQG